MIYEEIALSKEYDYLKENNSKARLVCMIPHFLPEMRRDDMKRPAILVCPGGGYGFCSEREAEPIAAQFMKLGFNAYVLYYSTGREYHYPLQLNEAAAAFEVIKAKANEHKTDIEKVGIIGFSAGGHLAAHYSTSFDCEDVRKNFKESVRPFASILCYPVITADERYCHRGSFEFLLGEFPSSAEGEKYSCDKLVKKNTPPAFIWHTASDGCVPVKNSFLYAEALSNLKIPFELHIYPSGDHGLSTSDIVTLFEENETSEHVHEWLSSLEKWIKITF